MKTFAILDELNIVVNLILADETFCAEHYAGRYAEVAGWCDLGATYDPKTKTFQPS